MLVGVQTDNDLCEEQFGRMQQNFLMHTSLDLAIPFAPGKVIILLAYFLVCKMG